jgi:DNA polymerase elongation subunit (family B)
MFTRIFYNAYKNKLYCIENNNGKRNKIEFSPEFEYYVPDNTEQSPYKDIYGNPMKLQISDTSKGMKEVASCTKCAETDIPGDVKFLQKRYKGKKLKVDIGNFQIATIDIEVESPSEFPEPEDAKYPINLISVHYSKEDKTYTFGIRPYTGDLVQNFHYCADEKTMIERFIRHFRVKKVDILTGWFSRTFDIPYIINRCRNLKIDEEKFSLSPINLYRKKHWSGYHIDESDGYEIAGISILDGVDIFKNFEREKRVSYSLQNIGMEIVSEGKKDYEGTINNAWQIDWNGFVEYNVQDVLLVKKIEEKKKYIELTITLCYQALIPFQRIFSSISLVEGYILKFLHEKNIVLLDHEKNKYTAKIPGAFVFAKTGHHKYCMSIDAESLYPFTILQFGISPETLKLNDSNFGKTPLSEYKIWETVDGDFEFGGIYYDRTKKGIFCQVTEDIIEGRKRFKKKMFIADAIENNRSLNDYPKELVDEVKEEGESSSYYDSQQYVRKILANSLFGCACNEYFHLYNYHNGVSITLGGQSLIKYMQKCLNDYFKNHFHKIVYKLFPDFKGDFKPLKNDVVCQMDTDSVFLCFEEIVQNMNIVFKDDKEIFDWINYIDKKFIEDFVEKCLTIYANKFDLKQIMNFKREKIITNKLTIAKKKYADRILANEDKLYLDNPKISVTGIEIVRTDTPSFCREKLKDALKSFFDNNFEDKQTVLNKIRDIRKEFINSKITQIAIPKGVSEYTKYAKDMDHYIKNGLSFNPKPPIHVRASINYNFLIKTMDLPLIPVNNGTKVKFIHVSPNNIIQQDVIAFINEWPEAFNKLFVIDYEYQFQRTFITVIQRFFDVLDWGNINIEENSLSDFITF